MSSRAARQARPTATRRAYGQHRHRRRGRLQRPRADDLDLDIDGVADDGAGAETDNIGATTENMTGGSGDDDLTGGTSASVNSTSSTAALATTSSEEPRNRRQLRTRSSAAPRHGQWPERLHRRPGQLLVSHGQPRHRHRRRERRRRGAAAGCEDDDVQSTVERVIGGDGNDSLTGSTADNRLQRYLRRRHPPGAVPAAPCPTATMTSTAAAASDQRRHRELWEPHRQHHRGARHVGNGGTGSRTTSTRVSRT